MAPPKQYKLTYFTLKGLGEPIRFLLAQLGRDWADERVSFEDWPKTHKPNAPWGKCPILEVDGQRVTQSRAICRYLGREAGLAGDNSWQDLRIDEAADVVDELRDGIARYFWNPDPAIKASLKGPLYAETLPFYLTRLEAQAKANGGYLANGKLSWADMFLVSTVDYMSYMLGQELLSPSAQPTLCRLVRSVCDLPNIKAYIAQRPPHN